MKYQPEEIWDAATWADIDEAVADEVSRVGVARRAFRVEPLMAADGTAPSWISGAAVQGAGLLRIPEGDAHPFVEISAGFTLTGQQVENEGTLHIGRTLGRMAAKHLAGAEDAFVLQGTDTRGLVGRSHASVSVTATGFVERRGVASDPVPGQVVTHLRPAGRPRVEPIDASRLLNTLTSAIAGLLGEGWPDPYVLILGTDLYSLASSQLVIGSTQTPADRLGSHAKQVLLSSAVAAGNAVVVSLAGDATTIYMARDVSTAFVGATFEWDGVFYRFRVFERIQYAVRDPLSIGHILP